MMVRLTMTPAIKRAIVQLQKYGYAQGAVGDEPPLDHPIEGDPITHGQIIEISKKLKQLTEEKQSDSIEEAVSYHLDDLLRGSKVYVEPPKPKVEPVPKPSPKSQRFTNSS